jgi:Lrp/AsnC family leucine-responsive transcriptional regulator
MSLDLEKRFPRVKLGFFPSPLHKLERMSKDLGIELWAKRDDVSSGLAYGGNKVRKLFESGIITGVRAHVDPKAVQRETAVLVGVVLDRSTPESFQAFEAAARALPPVLECYLVAGDVDYFIKLRVKDIAAFNRLHSERLIALPGVRQVRTFFVLNEIKTDGLLPI